MAYEPQRSQDEVVRIKAKIQEILEAQPKITQKEIVRILDERKIYISQATISRYIKEMGYDKKGKGGYFKPEVTKVKDKRVELDKLLQEYAQDRIENVRMAALKTKSGFSQLLDVHLKEAYSDSLLGTVTLADTIILVVNNDEAGNEMLRRIGFRV